MLLPPAPRLPPPPHPQPPPPQQSPLPPPLVHTAWAASPTEAPAPPSSGVSALVFGCHSTLPPQTATSTAPWLARMRATSRARKSTGGEVAKTVDHLSFVAFFVFSSEVIRKSPPPPPPPPQPPPPLILTVTPAKPRTPLGLTRHGPAATASTAAAFAGGAPPPHSHPPFSKGVHGCRPPAPPPLPVSRLALYPQAPRPPRPRRAWRVRRRWPHATRSGVHGDGRLRHRRRRGGRGGGVRLNEMPGGRLRRDGSRGGGVTLLLAVEQPPSPQELPRPRVRCACTR